MERLKRTFKNLGLYKAFVFVTFISLVLAFLLSSLTISICVDIRENIAPTGLYTTYDDNNNGILRHYPTPSAEQQRTANVVETVQNVLLIGYFILAVIVPSHVMYRCKLKGPVQKLQAGAQHIMEQDLDFSIMSESNDELGQLCDAFEAMRIQLKHSKQELWRQAEERKHLNAAFAHDLRNPVTVLKGFLRVMETGIEQNKLDKMALLEKLQQLEQYTKRIECYIEAMSHAQKLEEMPSNPKIIAFDVLQKTFQEHIQILTIDTALSIRSKFSGDEHALLWLDTNLFHNIAENLITNASRYAQASITVDLTLTQNVLILSVQDDGPGFSEKILQKGMEPFVRDKTDEQHFGMGLYICRLLCLKHNGSLHLTNTVQGARAIAKLKISQP